MRALDEDTEFVLNLYRGLIYTNLVTTVEFYVLYICIVLSYCK